MDLELEGKIVVMTGATGGIGRQICLDFLDEFTTVICLYRNEEKFKALIGWIKENGIDDPKCFGIECDLLHGKNLAKTMSEIQKKYGRIDVLVNCAGSVIEYPFALMEEKHIDQMINTNLKTTMLTSQAVLKPMFKQRSGSIINISSIAAEKGGRGVVAYAAAKSGIDSFTRGLAREVGKRNIRVNAVRPGIISTEMSKGLEDRSSDYLESNTILRRTGLPHEVSKMVVFLASEKTSSFITGTCVNVDGGLF